MRGYASNVNILRTFAKQGAKRLCRSDPLWEAKNRMTVRVEYRPGKYAMTESERTNGRKYAFNAEQGEKVGIHSG